MLQVQVSNNFLSNRPDRHKTRKALEFSLIILGFFGSSIAYSEDTSPKVSESTKIEPEITYRSAFMTRRFRSAFFSDKKDTNYVDQLYLTFLFARQYDYRHDVVIEPSIRTPRNRPNSPLELLIEQGYVRLQVGKDTQITTGKKTEYEGSGFMVSPSDLLNEKKDIFDSQYQREGKFFTKIVQRFGSHSLGLGYRPARGKDNSFGKLWLQGATDLADIDMRFQFTNQRRELNTFGLSLARFFGDTIEFHFDGRYQQRQRHIDDNPALDSPEANSSYKFEDASGYYLGGSRIVVTPRRSVIIEGIQNQSGLLPDDFKAYYTEVRRKDEPDDPETRLIGRHYAFVSYQDDDSVQGLHIGLSYLTNLNDKSTFFTGQLRRYLSPITSVELAQTTFTGSVNTEFGEMPFGSTSYLVFKGRF